MTINFIKLSHEIRKSHRPVTVSQDMRRAAARAWYTLQETLCDSYFYCISETVLEKLNWKVIWLESANSCQKVDNFSLEANAAFGF